MKALEKDRDKRYQTAWEMQYDLDQFLSQYEFTPSNIHLSNFLKQLFDDELEEEKKRIGRTSNAAGPGEIVEGSQLPDSDAEEIISELENMPPGVDAAPSVAGPI